MRNLKYILHVSIAFMVLGTSCSTLEKASMHGLNSGFYKYDSGDQSQKVYLDVTPETIDVYPQANKRPEKEKFLSIPLHAADSLLTNPVKFKKQSLDIDITTVLLKYRPSQFGLPAQLNTEFNAAIYAGWRFDNYKVSDKTDPLNRMNRKITGLGYDFGVFAGPGSTQISPFTTNNRSSNEYSGMIMQLGVAGFIESNVMSFGVAVGFDTLLNQDKDIWIYHNKPWVGFIVGFALN